MIDEQLQNIFRMVMGDQEIVLTEGTTAQEIDGWDSVAHINLMFVIETEYGIEFSGNEFAEFTNVGELHQCILGKVGAAGT